MENNSYLLETLKEFGNISGGNAAASLALLMDTQVYLSVSKVDKMTQLDLKTNDLRVEEHMISILLPFDGDMEGMLLFLLNQTFAQTYLKKGDATGCVCAYQLQEQELKMLEETASIMASAFMEGIASYLKYAIRIQQPSITMDMKGSILNEVLTMAVQDQHQALRISRSFWVSSCETPNELIFLVKGNSVDKLCASLEVSR
ncbi:MAG: chemotaxis protein CheC [Longicatena caecimuris]|uniref:chemotaxis protein CheC n=2 Tax=Longicatena caecimuris TaxID=1796635 RepID=UPI003991EE0F